MSLRRLDEFAFVYEKVASYANFRASFSSEIWDQASESFDRKVDTALDKCIVPEDSHIENELYLIDTDDES